MSDVIKGLITESTLDEIGDAIRSKNGEVNKYYPSEMPAKIRAIPQEGGAIYSPGEGIDITDFVISVTQALRDTIAGKADSSALTQAVNQLTQAINGKSAVSVDPKTSTGTLIAEIDVDGTTYSIYAPSGGIGDLEDLGDVVITSAQNGDVLKYDSTAGKWVNAVESGGTEVIANPTGTPTEELNSIKIGDTVYEIVGGGGGGSGYTATLLYDCQGSPSLNQVTLSDSWKNYDALYIEGMFNGEAYFGNTKTRETLQQAADNNMYVGFLSFANTYIGLNRLSNDGVTLSFYGQNTNGVTRIFGLKYGSGGGGQSGDVETLFTASAFTPTINLTKDLFNYDLITLEVSDGNGYTRGISFAPSELSLNQIIGFDNTYGYIWNSITSGTVLTNVSQYNFFIASVVGMKMGAGGTGGASAVSDLTDVDLNNLSNGQVLKYNSTTQKWENANESGGGSTLPFDVVINSTDNGIDIVYDDGT